MRITVCETPNEDEAVIRFWDDLCRHCELEKTELLVLPDFAFLAPIWERETFDPYRWLALERESARWIRRMGELGCSYVVGTRPVTVTGRSFNQGFLWRYPDQIGPLRSRQLLANELGNREARWFANGTNDYSVYVAGPLRFGLNISTELWDLSSLPAYARAGAHAIISPRTTSEGGLEPWIALAKTVAIRTGAFSISSSRLSDDCGSRRGGGWIVDPRGTVMARTSASAPIATVHVDISDAEIAKHRYPTHILAGTR